MLLGEQERQFIVQDGKPIAVVPDYRVRADT